MASSTLESDQQILARSNKKREDSKSNKQKTSGTVGQLISREKVQQQNIQPRKTRQLPGFGRTIVNQVDRARERITTIAPTATTTTTTKNGTGGLVLLYQAP